MCDTTVTLNFTDHIYAQSSLQSIHETTVIHWTEKCDDNVLLVGTYKWLILLLGRKFPKHYWPLGGSATRSHYKLMRLRVACLDSYIGILLGRVSWHLMIRSPVFTLLLSPEGKPTSHDAELRVSVFLFAAVKRH